MSALTSNPTRLPRHRQQVHSLLKNISFFVCAVLGLHWKTMDYHDFILSFWRPGTTKEIIKGK